MRSAITWCIRETFRITNPKCIVRNNFSTFASSTIFAVSSGRGKCGVAVVRVSGPKSLLALTALTGLRSQPEPRLATLRTLRDPNTQQVLDKGLFLWFPGPKSFTGEDSCELHVHGGPAVVAGVIAALGKVEGLRPAEPGEFSKRAFYNGKLDLTQAEGLADLIDAETEMQRQQALLQMKGSLKELYESWRAQLLKNVANVEAYIDFSEDENIESDVLDRVQISVRDLQQQIEAHLNDGRRGERLRDGVKATIVGQPNVGKSSLLNILCRRPAAIVSSVAGTTRDVVEKHVNIGGYPLTLSDTAGLRSTDDLVEHEGVLRARESARIADLLLVVLDAGHVTRANCPDEFMDIIDAYMRDLELGTTVKSNGGQQILIILNKWDLLDPKQAKDVFKFLPNQEKLSAVALSCFTNYGLDELLKSLERCVSELCGNPRRENPMLSQERHRHHLAACLQALTAYTEFSGREENLVIAAQELRLSMRALSQITGAVTTEDILDVIFQDFCIGK